MKLNLTCALLVFIIAFSLRVPLVDKIYQYSFEPDSESCIEVTRSFYFFFKAPCAENFPQTLTPYPNYSDGDFIVTALMANAVRPLCKAGIIKTPLTDSDNSLVIFSMRWGGVLFDALAASIAFLIFALLTQNTFISLAVTLLYYLLNAQTLGIDFIRIDHYGLLTGNLAMLAAVLLFKQPGKTRYYILSGIAAGLVTGTKINFPFYLLALFLTACYLAYKGKIPGKHFALGAISFLLATAFMYQRWLMYPENIAEVIAFTFNNGKVWTEFWGTDNHSFYLWDSFFTHGFSTGVCVLLVLAYTAFFIFLLNAIIKKNRLHQILAITFILQSLALMFSPKVGRYGIIMPLWLGLFTGYSISLLKLNFALPSRRLQAQAIVLLLLLPSFAYSLAYYITLQKQSAQRAGSIIETRVNAAQWMVANAAPGSVIAAQHPRVSNPPVYDEPYFFDESYLKIPFLFKNELAKFYPPNRDSIKALVNYIIISDKEMQFHLFTLGYYHCDTDLINSWKHFYALLDTLLPHHDFSSAYDNYGVKSIRIYEVNKTPVTAAPVINDCKTAMNPNKGVSWKVNSTNLLYDYNFQIQVAADSDFRWLVSGSRDGFYSRYREKSDPVIVGGTEWVVVPPKIAGAFLSGKFNSLLNGQNPASAQVEQGLRTIFEKVLVYMVDSNTTLREGIIHVTDEKTAANITGVIKTVYGAGSNLLDAKATAYIEQAGLKVDTANLSAGKMHSLTFYYQPHLAAGHKYYWRVRLRNQYNVMSSWSSINTIVL